MGYSETRSEQNNNHVYSLTKVSVLRQLWIHKETAAQGLWESMKYF